MKAINSYIRQRYTANQTCVVKSTNPGNAILRRWTTTTPAIPGVSPGSDANNMTLAFGLTDAYGLPVPNTPAAPDYSGNINGLYIPDTSGYQVAYTDGWIVLPVGVTVVSFGARGFGNTSAGIYVGYAPRFAKRILWGNVYAVPGGTVDASKYQELCGCKFMWVRTFAVNGYFHGGHYVQWNVGAGFVDVPVANVHATQPYCSQYPS